MPNEVHSSNDYSVKKSKNDRQIGKPTTTDGEPYKSCSACLKHKPVTQFFFKRTEGRYESNCKECKRKRRRTTSLRRNKPFEALGIARAIPKTQPSADFSLWEHLYGRALSDEEKIEIKVNLTGFVKLLLEEFCK